MTANPDPGTPQGVSSSPVEQTAEKAAADTANYNATRDLADAINRAATGGTSGASVIKGVVTAVATSTFTATLNGDTVPVPEIRYLDSYSPVVGDVVAILKLESNIFCLGQYNNSTGGGASANGWVTPTLASGVTPITADPVKYRVVIDNGDRKVQIRGGVNLNASQITLWTMPSDVRPLFDKPVILCGRDVAGGSVVCGLQVNANGTMTISAYTTGVRGTTTGSDGGFSGNVSTSSPSYDHGHKFLNLQWGTTDDYRNADYFVKQNLSSAHAHSITVGDHTHTLSQVLHPDALSFNGIEYFL